jgi:hypothetical protein
MSRPKPSKVAPERVEIIAQFSYRAFGCFISRSFDEVLRQVIREGNKTALTAKNLEDEMKALLESESAE